SNSVQSFPPSSLLFRRRLCIFHLPTRKSKSLEDDDFDAVIFKAPFGSKLSLGMASDSSVVRTGFCACPMQERATKRAAARDFVGFIEREYQRPCPFNGASEHLARTLSAHSPRGQSLGDVENGERASALEDDRLSVSRDAQGADGAHAG